MAEIPKWEDTEPVAVPSWQDTEPVLTADEERTARVFGGRRAAPSPTAGIAMPPPEELETMPPPQGPPEVKPWSPAQVKLSPLEQARIPEETGPLEPPAIPTPMSELGPLGPGQTPTLYPQGRSIVQTIADEERAGRPLPKEVKDELIRRETWGELTGNAKLAHDLARLETEFKGTLAAGPKGFALMTEEPRTEEGIWLTPKSATEILAERERRAAMTGPEKLAQLKRNPAYRLGERIEKGTVESQQPESVTRPVAGALGGLGSVAASLIGAPLGPPGILATSLTMELSDGFESEIARQRREGEPLDYDKARLKATAYAPGAAALEYIGGAGRLARRWFGKAAEEEIRSIAKKEGRKGVAEFFKRRINEAAAEGGTEALQRIYQDAIVEGKLELANAAQEGLAAFGGTLLLGAGVGGTRTLAHKIGGREVKPPPISGERLAMPPGAKPSAKPQTDFERYKELTGMKMTGLTPEESMAVWKEIETIKNRHNGYPPPPPRYEVPETDPVPHLIRAAKNPDIQISTDDGYAIGQKVTTLDEVEKLTKAYETFLDELRNKKTPGTIPGVRMAVNNQILMEAAQYALNVLSAKDAPGNHPLDIAKNPEAKAWYEANKARLGWNPDLEEAAPAEAEPAPPTAPAALPPAQPERRERLRTNWTGLLGKKAAKVPEESWTQFLNQAEVLDDTLKRVKGAEADLFAGDPGKLRGDPLYEALRNRASSLTAGLEVIAAQEKFRGTKRFNQERLDYGHELVKQASEPIPEVLQRPAADKIDWIAQFNPNSATNRGHFGFAKPFTEEEAKAIAALVAAGKIEKVEPENGQDRYRITGIEIPQWVEANWKGGKFVGKEAAKPGTPGTPVPPSPAPTPAPPGTPGTPTPAPQQVHPMDMVAASFGVTKKGTVNPDGSWTSPPLTKAQAELFFTRAANVDWVVDLEFDEKGKKRIITVRPKLTGVAKQIADLRDTIKRLETVKEFNPEKTEAVDARITEIEKQIAELEGKAAPAAPAPAAAPAEPKADKEPWQMTQAEFANHPLTKRGAKRYPGKSIADVHKTYVRKALEAGKPVPKEVLAEYPDLQATGEKKAPKPGQTTLDIEKMLSVERPDPAAVEEAKARSRIIRQQDAKLRQQQEDLEKQIKELEKLVISTRGSRWQRGQIKKSARAKDVKLYRELQKQHSDLGRERAALDNTDKDDRILIERAQDVDIILDTKQPLLRRLDRRYRMDGLVPGLEAALNAEIDRTILDKFPDATKEEIAQLRPEVARGAYFGDVWGGIAGVPTVFDIRRTKLDQALEKVIFSLLPPELVEKVNKVTAAHREWAYRDRPIENMTAVEADALIKQVLAADAERVAEGEREQARQAAEDKAEQAKESELIKAAQAVAESLPKVTGKKGGTDAKTVRDELVKRIRDAINSIAVNVVGKINPEGLISAENTVDGRVAFGEIEENTLKDGTKSYHVKAWMAGVKDPDLRITTTVDSRETAMWIIRSMVKSARGNLIFGVPGDGVFKLKRDGEYLLRLWVKARNIDTTAGHDIEVTRRAGYEAAPTEIKTEDQWIAAKEYHGLEPHHKIWDWSPALRKFATLAAKEIGKDAESLTVAEIDAWIERKMRPKKETKAEEAKPEEPKEGKPGGTKQDRITGMRIPRTEKFPNIFTMEEEDLLDWFSRKFPEAERRAGLGIEGRFNPDPYEFTDYAKFKKWMDERYAERDLEGMMLAFAVNRREFKASYVKDGMKSGNEHLKAWIAHMATGAPLPTTDPPVPRTTPRPTATGAPAPGPGPRPAPPPGGGGRGPQGPRPGQPPPQPRRPSIRRKFNLTALVQIMRQFGKHPQMGKRMGGAYGHYVIGTQLIELRKRLLWDMKLAERVLAHEFGHFLDFAIALMGRGKPFWQRVAPFWDFKKLMFTKTDLRDDAVELSRAWRGDFRRGDPYRDSADELFADFISAMFNNPEWVNQQFPRLHDAFQQVLDTKPSFKSAYREIETWLQGGTMARELRDQDRKAIERTEEIMMEEDQDRGKPALKKLAQRVKRMRDRAWFDVGTLWDRAFEKEGKPRLIGSSIAEQLENSYMWAAKKLALWNDDFLKRVQPHLDALAQHTDAFGKPIENQRQARADLLSYAKAVRTIGERRAAGVWIESHPDEAREMLQAILDLHGGLKQQWQSELDGAADDELYDLSARIFRQIHDMGEQTVKRIAREITKLNLGIRGDSALVAFNVRGKLLNPGGLTEQTARQVLKDLHEQLGPVKWGHLQEAGKGLRDLMFEAQSEMHNAGLISNAMWAELIAPNRNSYVPYAVLDYFEGKVGAGVMPQVGTVLDVADVVVSTQMKVAAAYHWLQRQRQVQLIAQAYERGGGSANIVRRLRRASELDRIQKENLHDDVSRAVIYRDGLPYLIEFPGDPGKLFEDALKLREFYTNLRAIHAASNFTHRVMKFFTQWNPRFILWRNVVRGFRTGALKVGFGPAFGQLKHFKRNYALAQNYAAAAFGGTMLPEVREMVESDALPPPHLAAGAVKDLPHMRELIFRGALPAFQIRRMKEQAPTRRGQVMEKARKVDNFLEQVFTGYEAFEKISNYKAAEAAGYDRATSAAVARRGGIPNPGVAGKWSSAWEIFFPWTRVKIQGMRVTYDMMRDPRFRKGFLARFAITEMGPRIMKVALAAGIVQGLVRWRRDDDDDEDDPVMREVFKRITPYKMALDDLVPLWLYDPRTGKWYHPWDFKRGKDIPKHFEVVSIRIPSSEEGNIWGTMLYNAMITPGSMNEILGKPGRESALQIMGSWAQEHFGPQPTPIFEVTGNTWAMVVKNQNPTEGFTGGPAANEQLFKAGGADKTQAVAGYILGQAGGPGEIAGVMAANFGLLDPRSMQALKSRLSGDKRTPDQKYPYLGTVLSHDNYAEYRDAERWRLQDESRRGQARNLMPPELKQMYDFHNKIEADKKKREAMTDQEREMFAIARVFVNRWGDVTGDKLENKELGDYSFYAKAMQAVVEGSSQRRKTVTQDMLKANEDLIILYNEAKTNAIPK